MRVVLTLLCRNEADIIHSTVAFHLNRGVDLVIATDNGSTDCTRDILQGWADTGRLVVLDEPRHDHDQAVWVTRMARLAHARYGADWVLHGDADEFWWSASGSLAEELGRVPPDVEALSVRRHNFLPPRTCPGHASAAFHQRQTIRERRSRNALGAPLQSKVCHRARAGISVSDGNHAVALEGRALPALATDAIAILHFPVRSYRQFARKIREGAEALARNTRVDPGVGETWRRLYAEFLLPGRLREYYDGLVPPPDELAERLASGELIDDRRLQEALADG